MIYRIMPGLEQLVHYKLSNLTGDITAGLIVAFLLIPQSMAYAMIAGVPIVLGLFAATFPLIIYSLFGSSKYLIVGPASIISLLAFSGISKITTDSTYFLELMIMLAFLVGVIQLLLGIIKFGSFFEYISPAAISGFTSAAAMIIAINQVRSLLGMKVVNYDNFINYTIKLFSLLTQSHLYTVIIGLGTLVLLMILKRKFTSFLGPVIVIIISIVAVKFFSLHTKGVQVIGQIPKGLPDVSIVYPTLDVLLLLFPIAFMIGFISFAESYAIAKILADKSKTPIRANQELFGLGLANMMSSFTGAFPIAGAISRTAVNYESGAKTNLSLLMTAFFMLIVTLYLTPLFYFLPQATLAAIIIIAVIRLIDGRLFIYYVKNAPIHAIIFLSTFIATLMVDIFIGLLIGIFLSVIVHFIKQKFAIVIS